MMNSRSRAALVVAAVALAGCGSTTASGTTATGAPTTAPTSTPSAATSASASGTPAGGCIYLDTATIQQDVAITVAITTQVQGGCFFESATGSHDAPNAVKYLHGHDGVILGISSGSLQVSPTCQQKSIPGVPAPAAVCQQTVSGGVTLAYLQLSGGRIGSLTIYAPSLPSLNQVDQLAAAAYPKMLAG